MTEIAFNRKGVTVLQLLIDLPLMVRLVALVVMGLIGGGLVNHVIYTWCWYPRPISPWIKAGDARWHNTVAIPSHPWGHRIPVLGWLMRGSETPQHGRWFAVRPLLIELTLAAGLPAWYCFICIDGGLIPPVYHVPAVMEAMVEWHHWIFLAEALLIFLMMAATFIDFDEQTIPDAITIPGTLLALFLSTIVPVSMTFMPTFVQAATFGEQGLKPLTFNLPSPLAPQWVESTGLLSGLAIWTVWCFALTNRRVIMRKGVAKAIEFFYVGLIRHPSSKRLAVMWLVGMVAVGTVWFRGGSPWIGLFTSLVGLAVGGGVIWAVRLVASSALRVEAMGFGDVTLMAMIGAFIGWQAALAAFFLSPLAAIAIVLVQYIITRESQVPFGPYLCAGTMLTIVFWDPIYNGYLGPTLLSLGPVLLWFAVAMFGLLGGMLFVWSLIKRALFRH